MYFTRQSALRRPAKTDLASRWSLPAAAPPTAPAPAIAPAAAPAAIAGDDPDNHQQHDRADHGIEDRGQDSGAQMDAKARQQPVTDKRADDPDGEVADQAEPAAVDNFAGEPSGDDADDHNHQQAFVREMHGFVLAPALQVSPPAFR